MLVLAIDTATPAVTVGVVEVESCGKLTTLASRVTVDPRAHTEVCAPQIADCLRECGLSATAIDAVVVGVGPGPFTGLRVGMATAAAFADAIGVPVHGVCTLDAIAADADSTGELLVVTDARRREVYWARYADGHRIDGPNVSSPSAVEVGGAGAVAGSADHAGAYGLPVLPATSPTVAGLVAVADFTASPAVPEPMYLRRPDAVERAR